jgi:hypothetical protein
MPQMHMITLKEKKIPRKAAEGAKLEE